MWHFFIYGLICLISWMGVLMYKKQLLLLLISLEFVLLMLFLSNLMMMSNINYIPSLSFYLLVLGASEASIGLSLLVSMTTNKGNDMLKKLNHLLN